MPTSQVSEHLRAARHEAGLSQRQLASRAGTSGPTVSAYESGSKRPRADVFMRLLAATGHYVQPVRHATRADHLAALLCNHIAGLIRDDPELIDKAKTALANGTARTDYRDAWERILDAGPEATIGVLTSPDPSLQVLRSDNPFSGLGVVKQNVRTHLVDVAYG